MESSSGKLWESNTKLLFNRFIFKINFVTDIHELTFWSHLSWIISELPSKRHLQSDTQQNKKLEHFLCHAGLEFQHVSEIFFPHFKQSFKAKRKTNDDDWSEVKSWNGIKFILRTLWEFLHNLQMNLKQKLSSNLVLRTTTIYMKRLN